MSNKWLQSLEAKDTYILLHGMFSTQLPPLLDEVLTEEATKALIKEIAVDPKSNLFITDSGTGLITRLSNAVRPPSHIYGNNWATESIKFYILKNDDSYRPMAIPNIKLAVMFAYNTLIMADAGLNELYNRTNRLNGLTKHSESPIIGRDGIFKLLFYGDNGMWETEENPVGFIGYEQKSKQTFFKDSKLSRFKIESTHPYILQIDLSKYFENIYTHLLSHIQASDLGFTNGNSILQAYFKWLDEYNQKINDNHTKGIIQGTISSKISAELLQLWLDTKIENFIQQKKVDANFTRYVDDYRFYGRKLTDLELIKTELIKIFRTHELSFNENKVKIYKGFELQKQARLNRYPELTSYTKGKSVKLNLDDFLKMRDAMILMISENDLPSIKSLLTNLKKQCTAKELIFLDDGILQLFIIFLIKMSYVKPIISSHIYSLIYTISGSVGSAMRKGIWTTLYKELDYIEEMYSETDLEVWYFYVLTSMGTSVQTSKVINGYLKYPKTNVLVLTVLLKKRSQLGNSRIQKYLLQKIDDFNTVSQSELWLPLSKLWIVHDIKKVDLKIQGLFFSRKGNIQWDQLGIIHFLKGI